MAKVISSVIENHAQRDLVPWMDSAYHALLGSDLLPRIPGFDIKILYKHKDRHDDLAKMCSFTDETWKLHDWTKAVKDQTVQASDMNKQLATARASWKSIIRLFKVLGPRMVQILVRLQHVAEEFYTSKMHQALHDTSKLIETAIAKKELIPTEVAQALDHCDNATLMATGLECPDKRAKALKTVTTARALLALAFALTKENRQEALINFVRICKQHDMVMNTFADLKCLPIGTKEQLQFLEKAFVLLFGPGSVHGEQAVAQEVFVNFSASLLQEGQTMLVKVATGLQQELESALFKESQAMQSVPELTKESRGDFLKACNDKVSDALLAAASSIDNVLKESHGLAESLEVHPEALLPEHHRGNVRMKKALFVVCAATSERILSSKAATKQIPSVLPSACPGFVLYVLILILFSSFCWSLYLVCISG